MSNAALIIPNFFDGKRQPHAQDDPVYHVTHPASLAVVHSVHASTRDDLDRAIRSCCAASQHWDRRPLDERKAVFLRVADILEEASNAEVTQSTFRDRLIQLNMQETAVTRFWAETQVDHLAEAIRQLVGFADEALASWMVEVDGGAAHVQISREPFGVCLAIPAWNASHALTSRAIFTPLLAGNTVLLKTSEITPATQLTYAELLTAAGVDDGALNVIHVAPKDMPAAMEQVIGDRRVRHVNFTGSTRVGSILAGLAGRHLKPSIMELGGKAPVIVLPDADLTAAANNILFGAFHNAGQICMSTERVIVPAAIYDALCTSLRKAWEGFEHADKLTVYSSTSSERIRRMVDRAVSMGARNVIDTTSEVTLSGNDVTPMILGPVTPAMDLYRDESFGPLAVLIVVDDRSLSEQQLADEMLRIANDSEYGLSAAVWSQDVEKAMTMAERLECGAVHINSPTPADPPNVPHGGWRSSGWGRFNGIEGLRGFTQVSSEQAFSERWKRLTLLTMAKTRSIEVAKGSTTGHVLPLSSMGLGV